MPTLLDNYEDVKQKLFTTNNSNENVYENDDDETKLKNKLLALNRVSASRSREKKKKLDIQMDIRSEIIETRNVHLKKRIEIMTRLKQNLCSHISDQQSLNSFQSQIPSMSSSSSFNIPTSLLFTNEDLKNEKRPIQVQTKPKRKRQSRLLLRKDENEEDRLLSQNLKQLYQEIEQTSKDKEEETNLLKEFFTYLPRNERSSLLTCSNDLLLDHDDNDHDLDGREQNSKLEYTNLQNVVSFEEEREINNFEDIQYLLNFVDVEVDVTTLEATVETSLD